MTQVRILSGGAAQGLCAAVAQHFLTSEGATIDGVFGAVGAMEARLRAGEAADVVILTRAIMDALAVEGLVESRSLTDIGLVQTGVAVRSADAAPAITTDSEFVQTLETAEEIYIPDPLIATAGIHFARVLAALGVRPKLDARLRVFPNGASAMNAMASAKAATVIGCTQVTEIRSAAGVRLVGLLPPSHRLATLYTAGVCTNAAQPIAAHALINVLAGPHAAAQRKAAGFDENSSACL